MDGQIITQFLTEYGYWIMFPLMIIEGPIVTLIAALLASFGVFDIYIVFSLSVAGDIFGDVLFYGAGRKWGMHFVQHIGRHIGITEGLVIKMEKFFVNHGGKAIMIVKSTTGLCWATFIAAGIVKMPFKKFLLYSFLGGLLWSAFLVFMGYFFGNLYGKIATYIDYAGWIVGGLAMLFFIGVGIYKKHKTVDLFEDAPQSS